MHALPIKPSNVYYRKEQEKEPHTLPHLVGSPKTSLIGKLRPASPKKRGQVLTAHRLADPLQEENLLASHPLDESELDNPASHQVDVQRSMDSEDTSMDVALDVQVAAFTVQQSS